jgi:hypothetical protein
MMSAFCNYSTAIKRTVDMVQGIALLRFLALLRHGVGSERTPFQIQKRTLAR